MWETTKANVKTLIQRRLARHGYALMKLADREDLEELTERFRVEIIAGTAAGSAAQAAVAMAGKRSRSQLGQDLFVLAATGCKRDGTFIEFGATDGLALSNTYLLESEYGWSGVLAEPASVWHEQLSAARSSVICHKAVWKRSGETLWFEEDRTPELSRLSEKAAGEDSGKSVGRRYQVSTISLTDLCEEFDLPRRIDYLSVDTEGAEWPIIKAHDFDRYRFTVMTIEHNFSRTRFDVFEHLSHMGYRRVLPNISKWDDWYIDTQT